jgi:phage terminase large subunit
LTASSITVTTGYQPRTLQADLHRRLKRFSVLVCHRRFGKTVLAVNELIDRALRCGRERPRYAYIAPYRNQAKQISWDYLQAHLRPIPGVLFNQAELRADLPNGSRITVYGADNPDSMRGLYFDGVVFDEFAQMPARLWSEIIRPALADRKGWAVWIGTPMGRNSFFEIYEYARTTSDPEWFAAMYKASETGILDPAELDSMRREMADEDRYQQELECSFQAAVIGAYYGPQMREAEEGNRVTRVPAEPHVKVTTAWDLGIGDSTAIWFCQRVGKEIRLIDYYEASGVGLEHYAKILQERGYVYGEHLLPHDVRVKELGTGVSRLDTLDKLGLRNVRVIPQLDVADGISAVRGLLPRCWFDTDKTKRGRDALAQYRREYDDRLKAFKSRPLHDWCSHAADAMRYLAVGLRDDVDDWSQPLKVDTAWVV